MNENTDRSIQLSRQELVANPSELVRQSSDVAGLCKEIVTRTALEIQGRKFVRVEGWQSIATAHGCVAGCDKVERVDGGFKAIGEIRRMSDGALLARAEGFVGEDEATWFGGEQHTRNGVKTLPKRPDYAIRAMAQTRAISRVCRSAFAHCVVLMDAGLSTTPAEEADFMHDDARIEERQERREREANGNGYHRKAEPLSSFAQARKVMQPVGPRADIREVESDSQIPDWGNVICTFGKRDGPLRGKQLGELSDRNLDYLSDRFLSGHVTVDQKDEDMVNALMIRRDQMNAPSKPAQMLAENEKAQEEEPLPF